MSGATAVRTTVAEALRVGKTACHRHHFTAIPSCVAKFNPHPISWLAVAFGKPSERRDQMIKRSISKLADAATCWLMQSMQWTVRNDICSREQIENYLAQGEKMRREEFFAFTPMGGSELSGSLLRWQSPVRSGYKENDVAAARIFLSQKGWSAPTLFFLHALMSAHDFGYERISRRLNRAGWNAVLVHLPYHYSRIPRGYVNGALALTSNLPRNGETIRQAVKEVRQLLAMFRELGCSELGLIGTSFGGWIGAWSVSWKKTSTFLPCCSRSRMWSTPSGIVRRAGLFVYSWTKPEFPSALLAVTPISPLQRTDARSVIPPVSCL